MIYRPPFDARGRALPWLAELSERSGVYVIRRRAGGPVLYVGESHTGRLAKTIKRHFYAWEPEKGVVFKAATVEVGAMATAAGKAVEMQNRLIRRLRPEFNILENPSVDENEPF